MKGIHVEDPSMHEFQSFSSSYRNISSVTEEKGDSRGGVDCLGKLLCSSPANWGMHYISKMVVPAGDKNQIHDAYVCRGIPEMGTIHRDDQQSPVDDVQVSMEAVMKNGYVGGSFKGYMCNEGDYGNNVQAPIAHIKGSHSGRLRDHMGHQDNYFSDFQASMEALHCNSPADDNSLWRFLPSSNEEHAMDYFSCDDFRMYEFKVRRCMRGRSHDWTECPFAHPGEKARRRDPRRFHYSGTACPDFRRGTCRRGDSCELSHGVFECWLHPARYRTQLCKDSKSCKRRVCFFAHSPSQLRFVSPDPVPNNGLVHNLPPLASLTDAMASYSDVPHKHSSFFAKHLSPTRQGSFAGHGADGFLDNFSPRNIPGFLPDVVHDGFGPMSSHSHSLNHSRRAPSDQNFEGFSSTISHIQGLSKDDLPNNFHLHSPHDHNCSYIPSSDALLLDDFEYQASHGHSYPHEIPSDTSSLKTSLTHENLRNQLALASLTSHLDQIMSPTSPLNGHVFSPPPLSPPLSPSESPPMSPGNGLSSRSTALARKIASISGHPLAFDGPSQILSPGMDAISNGMSPAVNYFQASLLANMAHSNMFASARGPSPLSTYSLGDQTHDLDGFTMPTPQKDESLHSASMETHPAHAMAHLISSLQQMELRRAVAMDIKSSGRSSYLSKSIPNSPKARLEASQGSEPWEFDLHHRVKSGQGLRATIYGKLGKEAAGFDVENPDLGWVNELVK